LVLGQPVSSAGGSEQVADRLVSQRLCHWSESGSDQILLVVVEGVGDPPT
jgi:hypothetical protein